MDWLRDRVRNLPFYPRLRRVRPLYTIASFVGLLWQIWKLISDMVGHIQNAIVMAPYISDALRAIGAWLNTPMAGNVIQMAGNVIFVVGLIGILWGLFRPDPPAARQLKAYLSDRKPEIATYIKDNGAAVAAPKKIIDVRPKEVIAVTPTTVLPDGTTTIQYAVLADVDMKEGRKAQKTETLDITLAGTVQKQEGQYVKFTPHAVIRIR